MKLGLLGLVLVVGCAGQVRGNNGLGDVTDTADGDVPSGGDDGVAIGDSAMNSDGVMNGDGGSSDNAPVVNWPPGNPGCGLSAAAFCDTFDAPAALPKGRSYELDSNRWSLARNEPDLGDPIVISQGMVTVCRPDVPAEVSPPGDTRICDGNDAIQSNHLLTVTAAQNYGSNAYRIRQPFDFAGRTGTIVFDADATSLGYGWIAVAVTEDPVPSPSFSITPAWGNNEGGVIPKNGLTVELNGRCEPGISQLVQVNEYRDYVDYVHAVETLGSFSDCITRVHNRLNHFELRLSQTQLEVWATDASEDGVTFGPQRLLASVNLGLTFTRGYVNIIGRNHATMKYWDKDHDRADAYEAWVARWDNVGFDGPVITNTREFAVPDALVPQPNGIAVGYMLGDASDASKTTVTIQGVAGVAQAVRARLAMNVHYFGNYTNVGLSTWGLTYRLNGHAWRTYDLSPKEEGLFANGVELQGDSAGSANALVIGVLGHVFDIEINDLVDGDNVLEIAALNVPFAGYPPTLGNVDLVLTGPTP